GLPDLTWHNSKTVCDLPPRFWRPRSMRGSTRLRTSNPDSSDASFPRAFMYISGPYAMKALHTQEVRTPIPSRRICSAGDFYAGYFDGALHPMARRSPAAERHEPLP